MLLDACSIYTVQVMRYTLWCLLCMLLQGREACGIGKTDTRIFPRRRRTFPKKCGMCDATIITKQRKKVVSCRVMFKTVYGWRGASFTTRFFVFNFVRRIRAPDPIPGKVYSTQRTSYCVSGVLHPTEWYVYPQCYTGCIQGCTTSDTWKEVYYHSA